MRRPRPFQLALVAAAVGTLAVYVGVFLISTTDDRVDQIDSDALRGPVSEACIALRTGVDGLPPLTAPTTAERRARVGEQAALVSAFTAQVRAAGDAVLDADVPARDWLADFERLSAERRAYADRGFTGTWSVPVEDGRPITDRMEAIGVASCVVPAGLTGSP